MLRDRDRLIEVYVLDRVDNLRAIVDRSLERFATQNESLTTRALVDDGGAHRRGEVVAALGLTAGVDQANASRVTVDDLPASEIDGVVGR